MCAFYCVVDAMLVFHPVHSNSIPAHASVDGIMRELSVDLEQAMNM